MTSTAQQCEAINVISLLVMLVFHAAFLLLRPGTERAKRVCKALLLAAVAALPSLLALRPMRVRPLAAVAVASDCDRMFWESQVGNARANVFYGSTVGADTVLGEHQLLTWKLVGVDRLMRCASVAV